MWRKNKSQQAKSLHSKQSRQHPGRLEKLIVLGLAWMKEGPFTLSLVRRKGISFIFLFFFSVSLHCSCHFGVLFIFSLSTRLELFAHQLHVNDGFRSPTADPCPVKDNPLYRRPRGGKSFGSNTQLKMETVSRFAKEACPLVLTFNSEYERLFMHLKFTRDLLLIQWLASNCYACSCAIQLSSTS